MKMQTAHFEALRLLFELHIGASFARARADLYQERNLTPMRLRWDLLWMINGVERQAWFDDNKIYSYLNDDHIDTALRVLVPFTWSVKP